MTVAKRIASFLLLIALVFTMVGCVYVQQPSTDTPSGNTPSGNTPSGNTPSGDKNSDDSIPANSNVVNISQISFYSNVTSDSKSTAPYDSFTDGKYNYFYFKLGSVENVPIYYSNLWEFDGFGEQELSITNDDTVTTILEKTNQFCINNTVNQSSSNSLNISPSITVDDTTFSLISRGYEDTSESAYSLTTSSSYTSAIQSSISNASTRTLKLTRSDPAGDYRFVIRGKFIIHAIVVADIYAKEYTVKYVPAVVEGSQKEGWLYGADGSFDLGSEAFASKQLVLNGNAVSGLNLYGKLDNAKFLRKKVHNWSDVNVTWTKGLAIGPYIGDLQNTDTIARINASKAIITLSYSTTTPSGTCEAHVDTYLSYNTRNDATKLGSFNDKASGTVRNYSRSYEVDVAKFLSSDGHLGIEFYAEANGFLDFSKNKCNFKNIVITVELI